MFVVFMVVLFAGTFPLALGAALHHGGVRAALGGGIVRMSESHRQGHGGCRQCRQCETRIFRSHQFLR